MADTTVDPSIPLQGNTPTTAQAMSNMQSLLGVANSAQQLQQNRMKTQQDAAVLQEQNALQQINPRNYTDPKTGIIDAAAYMRDAIAATPRTGLGLQRATQVYQAQAAQTAVSQAGQDLNRSQRQDVASRFAPLQVDPDAKYSDYVRIGDQIKKDNPQAGPLADSFLQQLNPNDPMDVTHKKAQSLVRAILPPGENQPKPTTVDTGGSIQPGAVSPTTGAITPAGTPIDKTLAPASRLPTLGTNAAGQTVAINPVNPNQASVVGAGNPAVNPTTAQAQTRNTAAAGVSERVQQAQVAANNTVGAQDALARAKAILESPNAPTTGGAFDTAKKLKTLLSGAGIDTQGAEDANTLVKNLARFEAQRATQAGLGGTDAARELAHAGSPSTALDNKALLDVVNQSLASEKAISGYARVQSKTQDPAQLLKNESDFRQIPNLIQGYQYAQSRSPAEADAFLAKHGISAADMKRTRELIKEFESR